MGVTTTKCIILPDDIMTIIMSYLNCRTFSNLLQTCSKYVNNKNSIILNQINILLSKIDMTINDVSIIGIKLNDNYLYMYRDIMNFIYEIPPRIKTYTSRTHENHTKIDEIIAYVIPSFFMKNIFQTGSPIYIRKKCHKNCDNLLQLVNNLKYNCNVTFFATLQNIPVGYIPILTPQYEFSFYDIENNVYIDVDYKIVFHDMNYFKLCDPLYYNIDEIMVFTLDTFNGESTIKIFNSSINEDKNRKVAMLNQVMTFYTNTYTK